MTAHQSANLMSCVMGNAIFKNLIWIPWLKMVTALAYNVVPIDFNKTKGVKR